jgi:hypothetical protein
MTPVHHWMSWVSGVDLTASTQPGISLPNVICHVARMVQTPVGSAASGLIYWQPDPEGPPALAAFVSTDPEGVGAYFGPHIFAGTPFEHAPVLAADITIHRHDDEARSVVQVMGHVFETTMRGIGTPSLIHRAATEESPFAQQGIEQSASSVTFSVDGTIIPMAVVQETMMGSYGAVYSAAGAYAR